MPIKCNNAIIITPLSKFVKSWLSLLSIIYYKKYIIKVLTLIPYCDIIFNADVEYDYMVNIVMYKDIELCFIFLTYRVGRLQTWLHR